MELTRVTLKQFVIFLVLAGMGWGGQANPLESKPYYQDIAKATAVRLPGEHLNKTVLGDTISEKALHNFLDALDPNHSIFVNRDILSFEEHTRMLDDELKAGHLEFAFKVFEVYKQRVQERVHHVNRLLETEFDVTKDESYQWKRDEAPWPTAGKEQIELWRKKIKNEYVGAKVSQAVRLMDAAKEESDDTNSRGTSEDVILEDKTKVETNDKSEKSQYAKEEIPEDQHSVSVRPDLAPTELIAKRYRQLESVISGHDAEWVLQTYLTAFAQAYDAHSTYLSERTAEDFDIAMKLSLTGIGAILTLDDGAAKIVRLIPGGPADRDGRIKPGDRIVGVAQGDGPVQDILFWPLYKSVRLIRGKPGTDVVLDVVPATDVSGTRVERINLVRDKILLEEKEAKSEVLQLPGAKPDEQFKLGVITLPDFYADQQGIKNGTQGAKSSAFDVHKLLRNLIAEKVDGILLDLRNNGGGSLRDAIMMTGFFIEEGPIVQVRQGEFVVKYRDPSPDIVYDGALVVLVNRLSASASEILAAALQDYGRAIIVGDTKTHGKGSVQTVFPLNPRDKKYGKLKVTTAGFYRINGESTQLNGVTPDVKLRSVMDVMEIGEEFLPNVLPPSRVEPASYVGSRGLHGVVQKLNTNSKERRNSDPEYVAYQKQVDRLASRQAMSSISLNFGETITDGSGRKGVTRVSGWSGPGCF